MRKSKIHIQQLFTLLRGNAIAQAIPVIITPIITRLYSIEALGALAIFVSLSSIMAALSPAGLEQAIMLPKSNRRADRVMALSLLSVLLTSILATAVILFIYLIARTNTIMLQLGFLVWLLPMTSAFMASTAIFNQMHLRHSRVSIISNSAVTKFFSLGAIQVFWGWFLKYGGGLIFGRVLSSIIQFLYSSKQIKVKKIISSKGELVITLKRYKKFPLFNIWGTLANISAIYIVALLIAQLYSVKEAGEYALIQRVLVLPIYLIGQAVSQVYYRNIVKEKNNTGTGKKTYFSTVAVLMLLGICIFVPIYLWGSGVIDVFLGGKVENIDGYLQILIPMFFIRFISNPLSSTMNAFERQEVNMLWQIALLITVIMIFVVSSIKSYTLSESLTIYSIAVSIMYVIQLFLSFRIAVFGQTVRSS